MDKTTLSFQAVIEIDNEKKTAVTTLIIDTTINGHTEKRRHIFDEIKEFPNGIKDLAYRKKIMDIIFLDIDLRN